MLIPSQLRSRDPLRIQEGEDGAFTVVNAYEGDAQEFFEGRLTPLRAQPPRVALSRVKAKRAARPQSGAGDVTEIHGSNEAELRNRVYAFLKNFHPGKEADPIHMGVVFEKLKRSGSLCVSQIAIETGLSLGQIFLALRQLRRLGAIEWRPDRKPWRSGERRPYHVQLIDTAWSISRSGIHPN
jgi:hypothetical protein